MANHDTKIFFLMNCPGILNGTIPEVFDMTQRSSSKRRNTCCIISLCCLVSGVLGTIVSVFLLYKYFDFFNIWDRTESEVLKTQNFFSVLALIFIIVFNAGWVFLIPAGVKKESKPFLFTLLGVYLIIIFVVIKSLLFGFTIPFM